MSRNNLKKVEKGRFWEILLYPSSAPNDWLDIIESFSIPTAISPLHDKDKTKDNDKLVEPHYHVLFAFNGPTTMNNILEMCKELNIPQLAKCKKDCKTAYDYHIHKYNSNKYQYNDNDRILINGFNIDNYKTITDDEENLIVNNLLNFIKDNEIYEYSNLLDTLYNYDVLLFNYAYKHTTMLNSYLKSRLYQRK